VPNHYQLQPLHDGRNKKKIGQELGNRDRLSQGSEQIENVYTNDATASQLAKRGNGIDAGSEGVLWGLPMLQREQS
jgi:hypothetical protein